MKRYQITHIRLYDDFFASDEKITHIKLSDGSIQSIAHAVKFIDDNYFYYYVNSSGHLLQVETVHPKGDLPYIRTKNLTTKDKLLGLLRF